MCIRDSIVLAGLLVSVTSWQENGMPALIQSDTLLHVLGVAGIALICAWMVSSAKPRDE